jgi:GTP-binding protein LepA
MALVNECRGIHKKMEYIDPTRVELFYEMPLAEIMFNFYDKLNRVLVDMLHLIMNLSIYRASDIVKVDILVNEESVDALSFMVHGDKAYKRGREIIER